MRDRYNKDMPGVQLKAERAIQIQLTSTHHVCLKFEFNCCTSLVADLKEMAGGPQQWRRTHQSARFSEQWLVVTMMGQNVAAGLVLLFGVGIVNAQEEVLCYGAGSIVLSVVLTLVCVAVLIGIVFVVWRKYKQRKGESMVFLYVFAKGWD